jgi:hypothetical protein
MVGALLVGSIVESARGARWASALTLGATIVLLALAVAAAALEQIERDRALDLILQGREALSVGAVRRQLSRLSAPRTHSRSRSRSRSRERSTT